MGRGDGGEGYKRNPKAIEHHIQENRRKWLDMINSLQITAAI